MNVIGYTGDEYWAALKVAAEDAYREEVLDCGMEELTLDEYFTKEDWISDKINEWFERSMNE